MSIIHYFIIKHNMDCTLLLFFGFPMILWLYIVIEKITDWSIYNYVKRIIDESINDVRMSNYIFSMIILFAIAIYIMNYDSINMFVQNISSLIGRILLTPTQIPPNSHPFSHTFPNLYAYRYAFVRRIPDIDEINGQFF